MQKVQYKKAKLKRLGKLSNLTLANGSAGGDSGMRKMGMGT